MAKEKKAIEATGVEQATVTEPAPAKEKKARTPRAPMNATYIILKTETTDAAIKELPKQAAQFAQLIVDAGETGISRDALMTAATPVVKTVQPITRIFDYYRKMLEEKVGLVVSKPAKAA